MSLADRRTILGAVAFAGLGGWPGQARAASWRLFKVEIRIRPPASISAMKAGVSVPLSMVPGERRLEIVRIASDANRIDRRDQDRGLVAAEWAPGAVEPWLDVVWLASVRDGEPATEAAPWIDAAAGRHPLAGRHWSARWTPL